MKTRSYRVTHLHVTQKEAERLAHVLVLSTGGLCVQFNPTRDLEASSLHHLWKWLDGLAKGPSFVEAERALGAEEYEAFAASVAAYFKDVRVAELDDVDVSIVRGLLFSSR